MGKLEDIVARNRRNSALGERNLTSLLLGAFLLVIIGLAAFTELGRPHEDPPPTPNVDGVLLGAPHTGSARHP